MKKIFILLIIGMFLLASCNKSNKEEVQATSENLTGEPADESITASNGEPAPAELIPEMRIIKAADMPKTLTIDKSVAVKGLENYETLEATPQIFFESGSAVRSAVLIENNILYFGNEDCKFYAVDITSKQQLWVYSTDEAVETCPIFTDGKIIFNAGNSLYILNASDGSEIHKIKYPAKSDKRVSETDYTYNDSYAAVSDGVAYYAALDGDIIAVDINKGEIIWTVPNEESGSKNPGVVVSGVNFWDGKLYYSNSDGNLCCVDTKTKHILFQTQLKDLIFAPMNISGGKIYIGGRNCKTYCIDALNGDVLWSSYSKDSTTWISGGSVVVGNVLYACTSDEHTIAVFDKNTGELLRLYPIGANGYTPPVLNGKNIIVAATNVYSFNESYIMEFDTANNTKLWQASLDDAVLSAPAVYQGKVYFGSDSGIVYSIDLPD